MTLKIIIHLFTKSKLKNAMLKTYNKPQNNYKRSFLFDMEDGFFITYTKKITRELIAVVKLFQIIPLKQYSINKNFINKFIKEKLNICCP